MKVFISWSGDRSRSVAELLTSWIRCVLQAARPWLSTKDIDRGALWLPEINENLHDAQVGIICITRENLSRPWILFEAGALAKGLSSNRVCTLLIDLKPGDVTDPLAQFNHTLPTREGIRTLAYTLNNALGDRKLDDEIFERVFETNWPYFDDSFQKCLHDNPSNTPTAPRPESDLLQELLENSRALQHRMSRLEQSVGHPRLRNRDGRSETANITVRGPDMMDIYARVRGGQPDAEIRTAYSRLPTQDVDEMIMLARSMSSPKRSVDRRDRS